MAMDTLKRVALFLVFVLVQMLVLNQIHLLGYATPLLYVYFVLMLPLGYPRWASLLWGFFLGLCVDVSANTPGVASASLTLVAFVQTYLLRLFIPRDAVENLEPSVKTLGISKFLTYAVILVLLHCLLVFSLEAFTFFNWQNWLFCIVGSTLLTLILIMALEPLRTL